MPFNKANYRGSAWGLFLATLVLLLPTGVHAQALSGITFARKPDALYVNARKAASTLGSSIRWGEKGKTLFLNERALSSASSVKRLPDGTTLLAVSALRFLGMELAWDASSGTATVKSGERSLQVTRGKKRVEVDRTTQTLRAWQGDLLVLSTPVSTGRSGHQTPTGAFTAGPYKSRMHYSSLYNAAPMPYSVQVNGNVFIHGFRSVPKYPASHGCIRVPLSNGNPARWFYEWVDTGTRIQIKGKWRG